MKYLLVFLFLITGICDAQSYSIEDEKYIMAYKYIRQNESVLNKKWLSLFRGKNKKTYKKRIRNQFITRPSSIICFLPILPFKDEIDRLDSITKLTQIEINNPIIYGNTYGFNSFPLTKPILDGMADTNNSMLEGFFVITFSKPINNYLIAEATLNSERLTKCNPKILGRTMWLLFIFSESNPVEIKNIYFSYLDR